MSNKKRDRTQQWHRDRRQAAMAQHVRQQIEQHRFKKMVQSQVIKESK